MAGYFNKKLLHDCNLPDLVDLVTRHAILNFKKSSIFKHMMKISNV